MILPNVLAADLRCTLRTYPIREGKPSVVSLFSRFRFYTANFSPQRDTYAIAKEPHLTTTLRLLLCYGLTPDRIEGRVYRMNTGNTSSSRLISPGMNAGALRRNW